MRSFESFKQTLEIVEVVQKIKITQVILLDSDRETGPIAIRETTLKPDFNYHLDIKFLCLCVFF